MIEIARKTKEVSFDIFIDILMSYAEVIGYNGRVYNGVSSVQVQYADLEGEAQFLMIGTLAGMVLIQNCGVINIPAGHDYVIGQQYYTGADGEPVADSASGQKLFIPISKTQLAINM